LCFCRGELPEQMERRHQKCDNGNRQPSKGSLINTTLSLVSASEGRIYLVLDALDECCEWENLLDTVGQILVVGDVNLLITSRRERELADGLKDVIEITSKAAGLMET